MKKSHVAEKGSGVSLPETFKCLAYENKMVGREECLAWSSKAMRNLEHCLKKKCQSPWRLCIACVKEGISGDSLKNGGAKKAKVFDHANGLCKDHNNGHAPEEDAASVLSEKTMRFLRIPKAIRSEIRTVDIDSIVPLKGQPRKVFDTLDLEKLGASIEVIGQLERPKVTILTDGSNGLIDGERRWRSQKAAGAKKIEVEVRFFERSLTPEEHFLLSGCFNSNRVRHNYYENAMMVREIMGMKICKGAPKSVIAKEISDMYGYSTQYVGFLQKLAEADKELTRLLDPRLPEEDRLDFMSAIKLAYIIDHRKQVNLARRSINGRLTVKETERMIEKESAKSKGGIHKKNKPSRLNTSIENFIKTISDSVDHYLHIKMAIRDAVGQVASRKQTKESLYSISERIKELADVF